VIEPGRVARTVARNSTGTYLAFTPSLSDSFLSPSSLTGDRKLAIGDHAKRGKITQTGSDRRRQLAADERIPIRGRDVDPFKADDSDDLMTT